MDENKKNQVCVYAVPFKQLSLECTVKNPYQQQKIETQI
jgi:hypothetical protein